MTEGNIDKDMKEHMASAGLKYEYVIGNLWETRPSNYPLSYDGFVANLAKGFASNSYWVDAKDQGELRYIDHGFLLGLEATLHRLNYLTDKVKELENKLQEK